MKENIFVFVGDDNQLKNTIESFISHRQRNKALFGEFSIENMQVYGNRDLGVVIIELEEQSKGAE